MTRCMEAFIRDKGRIPTVWIDKFCLRQMNAHQGLKMLCKCITACDKMLVLCGPTFPHRMWCVWEIFTLFAFQSESEAVERITLRPLDIEISPEGLIDSSALSELEHFDVNVATCYDPNDEMAMKQIIDSVGRLEFNGKVRRMGTSLRSQLDIYLIDPSRV